MTTAYSTSKGTVAQLTNLLAAEYDPYRILCYAIGPACKFLFLHLNGVWH